MPQIAAPVAAWVGTSLGGGALATTIGAVAGHVAVGVVTGAVIGAATSALSGGDILDGALKGAVIGGVSSGVISSLGIATGSWSAEAQLKGMGLGKSLAPLPTEAIPDYASDFSGLAKPTAQTAGLTETSIGVAKPTVGSPAAGTPSVTSPVVQPVTAKPSFWGKILGKAEDGGLFSDSTAKILAGVGQGAASALLAPEEPKQAEFVAEMQRLNLPGKYQAQVANIKIPESWKKYDRVQIAPDIPAPTPSVQAPALVAPTGGI